MRLFEFELAGAIPNWSNKSWAFQRLHAERKKWRLATAEALLVARCHQPPYERAVFGDRRRVVVMHFRVHLVDVDAERGLAKPILDQMCAHYQIWVSKTPRKTVWVDGDALIYDDDERHLPRDLYNVGQVRVPHYRDQRVVVRTEVPT